MAEERRKRKRGNIVVWAILGLLVLALGGFGAQGLSGTVTSVAQVGDEEVRVNDYVAALQQEQARVSQSFGQALTVDQLRALGIDRQVMERLVAGAAIIHETGEMGLSVGDLEVSSRIRANPQFGGPTGGFDPEGYTYALRRAGLTVRDFERRTRAEAAQELLQAAVIGGTQAPDAYADAMAAWLAETRDATVAEVTADRLAAGTVAPTDEQLAAYLEENAARFERPETRRITYAWAAPDTLALDVEVDEADVQAAYDARADEFVLPARVLAERLTFRDTAAAEAARDALAAGETTFEALVEERGFTLDVVDQGELSADDVEPAVADALFALTEPGIAGPVETPLGPALYRVNAVLDERVTPLDDVRADLSREARAEAARRLVDAERDPIDDLLAGGATLEEMAAETPMFLGRTAWDASKRDGIAAYEAFREAAAAMEEGDFPELVDLSDGGLVALRVDGIDPAAVPPLEEIRAEVAAAWQADDLARRLTEEAEALAERLRAGEDFAELGLSPQSVEGLARDGELGARADRDVVDAIFAAEAGAVLAEEADDTRAYLIRVDAVHDADLDAPDTAELRERIALQTRQQVAQDLFQAYGVAVQAEAGVSVDGRALDLVHEQLLTGGGHGGYR